MVHTIFMCMHIDDRPNHVLPAGLAVVEFFTQRKLGVCSCTILNDSASFGTPVTPPTPSCIRMTAVLEMAKSAACSSSSVKRMVEKLLGQWFVVDSDRDVKEALKLPRTQAQLNFVTINGNMYRSSGVIEGGQVAISKHLLPLVVGLGSCRLSSSDGLSDVQQCTETLSTLEQRQEALAVECCGIKREWQSTLAEVSQLQLKLTQTKESLVPISLAIEASSKLLKRRVRELDARNREASSILAHTSAALLSKQTAQNELSQLSRRRETILKSIEALLGDLSAIDIDNSATKALVMQLELFEHERNWILESVGKQATKVLKLEESIARLAPQHDSRDKIQEAERALKVKVYHPLVRLRSEAQKCLVRRSDRWLRCKTRPTS